MSPLDGRRHPKGDRWGKKLPKQRGGFGCLMVVTLMIAADAGLASAIWGVLT